MGLARMLEMFKSDIEIIENETEGASPSHSNKKENEIGTEGAVNSSPQGAPTDFQKFAAGASVFATPSGSQNGIEAKRSPGRPRKHPKKKSKHSGQPETSSVDQLLTKGPEMVQKVEKKFVSMMELTAPAIRVIGAVGAAHVGDKRYSLTKEESEEIAKSLDKVLNEFIPDMENLDPKTAAVVGFAMTVGSIYAMKFQEVNATKKPEEKTSDVVTETVTIQPEVKPQAHQRQEQRFGMGPLG